MTIDLTLLQDLNSKYKELKEKVNDIKNKVTDTIQNNSDFIRIIDQNESMIFLDLFGITLYIKYFYQCIVPKKIDISDKKVENAFIIIIEFGEYIFIDEKHIYKSIIQEKLELDTEINIEELILKNLLHITREKYNNGDKIEV